jgi:hypothetical protein
VKSDEKIIYLDTNYLLLNTSYPAYNKLAQNWVCLKGNKRILRITYTLYIFAAHTIDI